MTKRRTKQNANWSRLVKNCPKCRKKTAFICSGKFRINAQKKLLDIWLIYKCSVCGKTWKASVFSRLAVASMPTKLLERFQNNDPDLAEYYAKKQKTRR